MAGGDRFRAGDAADQEALQLLAPSNSQPDFVHGADSDMAQYVEPLFSKREVVDAGKALAGNIPYGEEAIQVFRVAHNWRGVVRVLDASSTARTSGKGSATWLCRTDGRSSETYGFDPRKTKRGNLTLYRMQDIGGCRAMVASWIVSRQCASSIFPATRGTRWRGRPTTLLVREVQDTAPTTSF